MITLDQGTSLPLIPGRTGSSLSWRFLLSLHFAPSISGFPLIFAAAHMVQVPHPPLGSTGGEWHTSSAKPLHLLHSELDWRSGECVKANHRVKYIFNEGNPIPCTSTLRGTAVLRPGGLYAVLGKDSVPRSAGDQGEI